MYNLDFSSGFVNHWKNIQENSGECKDEIIANLTVIENLKTHEKLCFGSDGKMSSEVNGWNRSIRSYITNLTGYVVQPGGSDDIKNLIFFARSVEEFTLENVFSKEETVSMMVKVVNAVKGLENLKLTYSSEKKVFNETQVEQVQKSFFKSINNSRVNFLSKPK